MAKDSKIEWTHHTFNPWWGCCKVSPACDNCYAEKWARRVGQDVWGKNSSRRFFGDKHWKEPLAWNAEASSSGMRRRVFCASMADVFERKQELNMWRNKLWKLITDTPNLDWLLLTKRPQNIKSMVPWTNDWPENVWIGTTIENQKFANLRMPFLVNIPAKVRFLSCEPLLGKLDLEQWLRPELVSGSYGIDWIISGGESGPKSRPMSPMWALDLRDQSIRNNVSFHFKQWGHWVPTELKTEEQKKSSVDIDGYKMIAVGKGKAGRELYGKTWDQLPKNSA